MGYTNNYTILNSQANFTEHRSAFAKWKASTGKVKKSSIAYWLLRQSQSPLFSSLFLHRLFKVSTAMSSLRLSDCQCSLKFSQGYIKEREPKSSKGSTGKSANGLYKLWLNHSKNFTWWCNWHTDDAVDDDEDENANADVDDGIPRTRADSEITARGRERERGSKNYTLHVNMTGTQLNQLFIFSRGEREESRTVLVQF